MYLTLASFTPHLYQSVCSCSPTMLFTIVYMVHVQCAYSPSGITNAPMSQTEFLNREAIFTCVTRDAATHWIVNGTELPSPLYEDLRTNSTTFGEIRLFELTIPARAEYNGTRVQCVNGETSDEVTLTIQGTDTCVHPALPPYLMITIRESVIYMYM